MSFQMERHRTYFRNRLNPIIQGRKFQKQGCNIEVRGAILGPPGAGFFNYVSPGGWTCRVMHSGRPLHLEHVEVGRQLHFKVVLPSLAGQHYFEMGVI